MLGLPTLAVGRVLPPWPLSSSGAGKGPLGFIHYLGPSRPLLWRALQHQSVDRTFSVIIKAWLSVPCAFPLPIEVVEQVSLARRLPGCLVASVDRSYRPNAAVLASASAAGSARTWPRAPRTRRRHAELCSSLT